MHRVSRAMIVWIGRHYGYSFPTITPHAGYAAHSAAMHAWRAMDCGRMDGLVDSIGRNTRTVATGIIRKIDNRNK